MAELPRYLFPRIPALLAHDRYLQIAEISPAELSSYSQARHDRAEYAPTGGHRVTEPALLRIREQVSGLADQCGFPTDRTRATASRFDARCAELLHRSLPIIPAEAARNDVWNFVTLFLLPDVTRWRFPSADEQRFLGGVRNTFQRLWWRAHVFHDATSDDPYLLLSALDEDVMVGIMERPGVSANERLARSVGYAAAKMAGTVEASKLEDARRDALKRVRQRIPVVCLDSLSDEALTLQVDALFEEAAATFR